MAIRSVDLASIVRGHAWSVGCEPNPESFAPRLERMPARGFNYSRTRPDVRTSCSSRRGTESALRANAASTSKIHHLCTCRSSSGDCLWNDRRRCGSQLDLDLRAGIWLEKPHVEYPGRFRPGPCVRTRSRLRSRTHRFCDVVLDAADLNVGAVDSFETLSENHQRILGRVVAEPSFFSGLRSRLAALLVRSGA